LHKESEEDLSLVYVSRLYVKKFRTSEVRL